MVFVYKHETGTAISEMCFLCLFYSSWMTRKQDPFVFLIYIYIYIYEIKWTTKCPEVTNVQGSLFRRQFQCVGHLIVLWPVAGFPAVLLFLSSCFLHQKWDFQHLSASSLHQSRPLSFPSSHRWMWLWRAPWKCPVCVREHVCLCVYVFVCMSVWLQNQKNYCQEVPLLKIHQVV